MPGPKLFVELVYPSYGQIIYAEPKLEVSGRTLPWSFVDISHDSPRKMQGAVHLTNTRADGNGVFSFDVTLDEGDNVLTVISNPITPGPQERGWLLVIYDPEPPDLTISINEPADGARVADSALLVSGVTLPNAEVVVDGIILLTADDAGEWQTRIRLQPGAKIITATASLDGQTATASLTITYTP